MEKQTIENVLDMLVEETGGNWILVGGALALLEFGTQRSTEDIDIFSYAPSTQDSRFQLFSIAERLSLPIESINSAADFFLRSFVGWEEHLVLLRKGKKGKIFRPDLTLFLAMKLSRATESDLSDCKKAMKKAQKKELDCSLLQEWLKTRASFKKKVVQVLLKKICVKD